MGGKNNNKKQKKPHSMIVRSPLPRPYLRPRYRILLSTASLDDILSLTAPEKRRPEKESFLPGYALALSDPVPIPDFDVEPLCRLQHG